MEHPDAPPGKALKYTLVERERRFLLGRVPAGPCVGRAEITNHYLDGTRLRLRQTVETTAAATTMVWKLTQKIPAPTGGPGLITTLYLSAAEHAALDVLPGPILVKTRYSVPPFGIDVLGGELEGLVVAEIEFATDDEQAAFPAPPESVAEVTLDARFTGGHYLTMARDGLLAALAELGAPLVDATELRERSLTRERT